MNFADKIGGVIKRPGNAMKTIAEAPLIEEAIMIVGIFAVTSALAGYVQSLKIIYDFQGLETPISSMQSIIAIVTIVSALIGAFLIWLIGTGIIHLISMALGGEGKFSPQMLTVVGYSMIPLIFASIIELFLLSMADPVTVTISPGSTAGLKELYNNPYFLGASIVGLITQAWFSFLLYFGIQSAHKLSPSKSAIVAGIPLAMSIISFAWSRLI
jgi:hypothetical protein